jgi:hypothetical protein
MCLPGLANALHHGRLVRPARWRRLWFAAALQQGKPRKQRRHHQPDAPSLHSDSRVEPHAWLLYDLFHARVIQFATKTIL